MEELKIFLNSILWNQELTIKEKYNQVIKKIPNYLQNINEKKALYEKIEWIFHDWLWTYFELLIYDKINEFFHLRQPESDKVNTKRKMELWINLYNKFFANNEYNINLQNEIENIEKASSLAMIKISEIVWQQPIKEVKSSSQDFREWNVRDVYIKLSNWNNLNFSVKIDKSWKMAISESQTPIIQEKVYNRYFNLSDKDYKEILEQTFPGYTFDEIKQDYQNIALITQKVIIKQFWLTNVEINNFLNAKITNSENLKNLITQLRYYKRSKDNSIIIAANRETWELIQDYLIDEIDINSLNLDNFGFTKMQPKEWKKYWTTPCFQYWIWKKKKTFVSFQVKHERAKYTSNKFRDITIRLHE